MEKVKVKLITLGHLPIELDKRKVEKYKSDIFEITRNIEQYNLNSDSNGENCEFSDEIMRNEVPKIENGNILIAIVNVPLELDWYTRRVRENVIVFTFHEIKEYLLFNNIPLENVIYRLIYAYSIVYTRTGGRIPINNELFES